MKKEKDIEFAGHLNELRRRFLYSLVYFVIMLVVSFYFASNIVDFIKSTNSSASSICPSHLYTLEIGKYCTEAARFASINSLIIFVASSSELTVVLIRII